MTELRRQIVSPDANILDAIQCIDRNASQIALVADATGRLLGTVTDGDVRRAIIRGISLETQVSQIMTSTPHVVRVGASEAEILATMQSLQVRHLPVVDDRGVVVALSSLDRLLAGTRHANPVLLMAGGFGTRLRPLTDETPKPMLKIGGKPLLETILETFINQGFFRFYISLHYRGEKIRDYFGDGHKWGAWITYLEEPERMGTAGCLKLLPERPSLPFFVMNGDILTSVSFSQMLRFHVESEAMATMAALERHHHVPYGVLELDDHRLVRISEKPAYQFFINAGIYILNPATLDLLPDTVPFDMTTLFETLIAQKQKTVAFPIREYWLDIGHKDNLQQAEAEFASIFE